LKSRICEAISAALAAPAVEYGGSFGDGCLFTESLVDSLADPVRWLVESNGISPSRPPAAAPCGDDPVCPGAVPGGVAWGGPADVLVVREPREADSQCASFLSHGSETEVPWLDSEAFGAEPLPDRRALRRKLLRGPSSLATTFGSSVCHAVASRSSWSRPARHDGDHASVRPRQSMFGSGSHCQAWGLAAPPAGQARRAWES